MPVTQFRAVCFTDFTLRKWSQNDLKENDIQYVAYALETCPETKKLHHQAWAYSEKKISFAAWKKKFMLLCGNCHFEQIKGSFASNEKYCSKSGELIEIGQKPMESGQKRRRR